MRTYDLTPFYRSTVGFDRLFSLLDQATSDGSPGYPPYNIERTGENAYRISVAVSGFAKEELSIVAKENTLTIKGEKVANENGKDKSEVLYRGIAARAFERVFQLADFVVVKNASLEHGLLHVDLVREIPEAKKPRNIPIGSAAPRRRWSTARPRRPPPEREHRSRSVALSKKTPRETGAFLFALRHSGMARSEQSRNLAEIPGSTLTRRPGMTSVEDSTPAPAPPACAGSAGSRARAWPRPRSRRGGGTCGLAAFAARRRGAALADLVSIAADCWGVGSADCGDRRLRRGQRHGAACHMRHRGGRPRRRPDHASAAARAVSGP